MTDDHRDRDDHDDRDEPSDDHWLSTLLSALASLESGAGDERRTTGRRRGDRSVIDYDISIRSGDDLGDLSEDDLRRGRTPFTRDDGRGGSGGDRNDEYGSTRDGGRDRRRTRRTRSTPSSSEHRVATRRYDDELVVTADVGGVDPEDVTVGFDGPTLVIGVAGSELDRIDVPRDWGDRQSRAMMKNGVLTVQIEPEPADEESTDRNPTDEGSVSGGSTTEESTDDESTPSEDDHE